MLVLLVLLDMILHDLFKKLTAIHAVNSQVKQNLFFPQIVTKLTSPVPCICATWNLNPNSEFVCIHVYLLVDFPNT